MTTLASAVRRTGMDWIEAVIVRVMQRRWQRQAGMEYEALMDRMVERRR